MTHQLVELLLQRQNADGGWGAEAGRKSRTEPTSFALLALAAVGDRSIADAAERAEKWLAGAQNPDGSWPVGAGLKDGSWTTALASFALAGFEPRRAQAARGAQWLLEAQGRSLGWLQSLQYRWAPQTQVVELNPDLKGWPWTAGTFSWVEPTSYALLALKKLLPYLPAGRAHERIREGERLLYDRMCAGGGWNIGNRRVLGVEQPPYPDITALALMALADHRAMEANRRSLLALKRMLAETTSGLSLSWSILCLLIYGEDVTEWRQLCAAGYEKTGFLGETRTVALSAMALADGARMFRI